MAMFLKNHICAFVLLANIWLMHCAAGDDRGMALHRDQEITQSVARAVYERYESELRGKTQEELNMLLRREVSDGRSFDRSKIIALVYAGADPNFRKKKYESSVLICAIWMRDALLLSFLLERKADPNRADFFGDPSFWYCKSITLLDTCVTFGADVTTVSRDGRNILHYTNIHSAQEYSNEFLTRALELGASINQIDKAGYTPLMSLALQLDIHDAHSANFFLERAHLFLAAGAETEHRVTSMGHLGKTAADILRGRAQGVCAREVGRKTCTELARMIDRYPFRSLQELIIRNAILDARATDPLIAKPAQELVMQLKQPGTMLRAHNKKTFDRCFNELTPLKVIKINNIG